MCIMQSFTCCSFKKWISSSTLYCWSLYLQGANVTKPCDLACGPFVDYRNGWAATDYALKASSCKLISSVFILPKWRIGIVVVLIVMLLLCAGFWRSDIWKGGRCLKWEWLWIIQYGHPLIHNKCVSCVIIKHLMHCSYYALPSMLLPILWAVCDCVCSVPVHHLQCAAAAVRAAHSMPVSAYIRIDEVELTVSYSRACVSAWKRVETKQRAAVPKTARASPPTRVASRRGWRVIAVVSLICSVASFLNVFVAKKNLVDMGFLVVSSMFLFVILSLIIIG